MFLVRVEAGEKSCLSSMVMAAKDEEEEEEAAEARGLAKQRRLLRRRRFDTDRVAINGAFSACSCFS